VVFITRGLRDALLDMASEAEPERVTVVLATTPAGEFEEELDVASETPVLSHFYMPEAGQSVRAVFGMDLGTPAGRGRAKFVSHPQGPAEPTREDDFAAAVLVAVPPWDAESVAAFDRSGKRLSLDVLDADPPQESLVGD
jgi:proteasome lid subunit RPN8/RPN11